MTAESCLLDHHRVPAREFKITVILNLRSDSLWSDDSEPASGVGPLLLCDSGSFVGPSLGAREGLWAPPSLPRPSRQVFEAKEAEAEG